MMMLRFIGIISVCCLVPGTGDSNRCLMLRGKNGAFLKGYRWMLKISSIDFVVQALKNITVLMEIIGRLFSFSSFPSSSNFHHSRLHHTSSIFEQSVDNRSRAQMPVSFGISDPIYQACSSYTITDSFIQHVFSRWIPNVSRWEYGMGKGHRSQTSERCRNHIV